MAKTVAKSNPNGANQWIADPRQQLFLAYYLDPKSSTFSNVLKSGMKAGFEEDYARNLLNRMPDWLLTKIDDLRTSRLLEKAERNLEEMLELPSVVQAMGAFGPVFDKKTKKPIMVHSTGLLKIKSDASQFVAERVGKKIYGKDVPIIPPTNVNIMNIVINRPASKDS